MAPATPSKEALDALEEFAEMAALDKKVALAISKVMARSPSAVLIAWEENGEVRATTIPFSVCLAKGMSDAVYELLWGDGSGPAGDEGEEVDDN